MKRERSRKTPTYLCNGFKMPLYRQYISELLNDGFQNCIPILDNLGEIDFYEENVKIPYQGGYPRRCG